MAPTGQISKPLAPLWGSWKCVQLSRKLCALTGALGTKDPSTRPAVVLAPEHAKGAVAIRAVAHRIVGRPAVCPAEIAIKRFDRCYVWRAAVWRRACRVLLLDKVHVGATVLWRAAHAEALAPSHARWM